MIRNSVIALIAAGVSANLSVAVAQEAGTAVSVTGSDGSVIVLRGGETFSLDDGSTLFDGDKIITRADASVDITVSGCTRTIPANSTIDITSAFCDASIVTVDNTVLADVELPTSGGTGAALPILGGLGALGGLAAAAGGGGGGGSPSSP